MYFQLCVVLVPSLTIETSKIACVVFVPSTQLDINVKSLDLALFMRFVSLVS